MKPEFHVVIPARYQSSRLPGKMLMDIQGQSVLERVYRQALAAKPTSITIATDHPDISAAARQFGAHVVMTASAHQTGTDRIAEVIRHSEFAATDIIVNVQGDEPFIAPELISQVAVSLMHSTAPMATLCWPIQELAELLNPNVVKVVRDHQHQALYFSRSPIPANRDAPQAFRTALRHIGLYAYRADFLQQYVAWPVCELEALEALEQLRVLWQGYKIQVDEACIAPKQDINTNDDLERARQYAATYTQRQ